MCECSGGPCARRFHSDQRARDAGTLAGALLDSNILREQPGGVWIIGANKMGGRAEKIDGRDPGDDH